jgi:hypothetical protein
LFALRDVSYLSTHFVYQQRDQQKIGESRIFASHYFRPQASALLVFNLFAQGEAEPFIPVQEDASL